MKATHQYLLPRRTRSQLSFIAGWIVPEESCPIDYTDEELQYQSPRVRRLLGHRSYEPARESGGGGLWLRHVRAIDEFPDAS